MNWSTKLPTKPGVYWRIDDRQSIPHVVELIESGGRLRDYHHGRTPAFLGGLWCPLVPKDWLEEAWREGWNDSSAESGCDEAWNKSITKRRMEHEL